MVQRFAYRLPGLLLLLCCVPGAIAQSDAQKLICDRHHETLQCQKLYIEFSLQQLIFKGQKSALEDNPIGDVGTLAQRLAPRAIQRQFSLQLGADAKQTALQTISTNAATNQNGGAPTASGSTNLVSKPTTTDFISMAAESGAFIDTLNGTTMTIQANGLGLTKYFSNQPVFHRWESKYADLIQPLTFAVTLNVAQSGSTTAPTAGSANATTPPSIASVLLPTNNTSFSSFGVNYAVYRPYNPQDKNFRKDWDAALNANQSALTAATSVIQQKAEAISKQVEASEQQTAQQKSKFHKAAIEAETALNAHKGNPDQSFDKFVAAYEEYDNAFMDALLASAPDAPKQVLELGNAVDAFRDAVYTVLDKARGKPLATLSYLYSSPQDKPATHSFTAVISYLFKGDDPKRRTALTGAQLTANFTTAIYASLPAGVTYGRLRDFQLSGEFDKPFGGTPDEPRGTWSLAGYGQYQYDPTVLNITAGNLVPGTNIPLPGDAQVLLGTAGWLGVAQGKLTINLKKGLSIPVAVKWSNKTDLLKGNDVRGQVGLSYDLSALSKLISSAKN
ncbi:MAG TPA: hypothetical protein VGK22_05655 [Candidatus Angelobacter sp.]|jgi:hypothetical protein